jgi:hypothetical protein
MARADRADDDHNQALRKGPGLSGRLGSTNGEAPSTLNLSSEKFSAKTTFVPFNCVDNGIPKTTREHVSGKADRAEGLLRLRDTDTSLITFREK